MNRNCGRQEVIVIAALCVVVGIGCTEAPEEEPAPSADVEESTPGDDADRALQEMLAIETIKNYPEMLDAAISQDGQDFRLALISPG